MKTMGIVSGAVVVLSLGIYTASAAELAAAIRKKDVSARDVVRSHLERIAAVNGRVHAVTRTLGDTALAAADEADRLVGRSPDAADLR